MLDVVELLIPRGVLELRHLVEVLDAAVLDAPDRLVQLLPRQGADLQPGLVTHTAQGPMVASLEVLLVEEGVDAGRMLGDGEDHLDEELGIAVAGSQSVPDLVFHGLDPGPQRNALLQLRRLPQVLGHTLAEVPAVEVVNNGCVAMDSLSLFMSFIMVFRAPDRSVLRTQMLIFCLRIRFRSTLVQNGSILALYSTMDFSATKK